MKDNLKSVQKATEHLSAEGRRYFNNFFVGALSSDVPEKVWDHAIKIASQCVHEFYSHEEYRRTKE